MDSLTILKSLVEHLEPRRAAWPKVGRMNGYGKNYRPYYDVKALVNGEMYWPYIVDTVVYYLFQDVDVPVKQYSCRGGYSQEKEIQEYLNAFVYSTFGGKITNMYEKARANLESGMDPTPWNWSLAINRVLSGLKIRTKSVEEYLRYLITLEEKYEVDSSYIDSFRDALAEAVLLKNEKEERQKEAAATKAQENERIRIEQEKKEKERIDSWKRKKAEEEAKAFEEEVQRRVKLELYERRVKAEVERRLKAIDEKKAKVVVTPVVKEVAEVAEVKEGKKVEEVTTVTEVKPSSILEGLKKFF